MLLISSYLVVPPFVHRQLTLPASSSTASAILQHTVTGCISGAAYHRKDSDLTFRGGGSSTGSVRSSKMYSHSISMSLSSAGVFLFVFWNATGSFHSFSDPYLIFREQKGFCCPGYEVSGDYSREGIWLSSGFCSSHAMCPKSMKKKW